MSWFKRKPKTSYADLLYPITLADYLKEESRMSENRTVKDQTEPFIPEDYKGQHFGWLSPFTSEEKDELRKAKSPDEFERITGKLLYQVEQRKSEEAKREAALAAEKAKTHWATVTVYDNPHPYEGQADKLDDFMDNMYRKHTENQYKLVPLHTFKDGVIFVKLKDISSIHFTEEFMKERNAANEDNH